MLSQETVPITSIFRSLKPGRLDIDLESRRCMDNNVPGKIAHPKDWLLHVDSISLLVDGVGENVGSSQVI